MGIHARADDASIQVTGDRQTDSIQGNEYRTKRKEVKLVGFHRKLNVKNLRKGRNRVGLQDA